MARTKAFDENAKAYDAWFDEHKDIYHLELDAISRLLPGVGEGVEIGVGTGRFAKSLGVRSGIEPSAAMREIALQQGIDVIDGIAEDMPLKSNAFDFALFVTTLCFLDSLEKAFNETYRILKVGGHVVIGFIEKESSLGQKYESRKGASRFYKDASFHRVEEIIAALIASGFTDFRFVQTLFPETAEQGAVKPGYGIGAFVVVRARKE